MPVTELRKAPSTNPLSGFPVHFQFLKVRSNLPTEDQVYTTNEADSVLLIWQQLIWMSRLTEFREFMAQILRQQGKGFVNKFTNRHIVAAWSWTLSVADFRFSHLKPILESDKKWRRLILIKHRHWRKMFLSRKTGSITCAVMNKSLNFSELDSLFVHCEDSLKLECMKRYSPNFFWYKIVFKKC